MFAWNNLRGVYMTQGWHSHRSEFTPVPSNGSTFVYMIPPQNVMLAQVTTAWVHPGCCTGARISLPYKISQPYHVKVKWPHVLVWNRYAHRLERVAHAQRLRFWILRVFYQHEVYLQITRYEMTQSWCNAIRNKKVIPVRNSCRCEFSYVNNPFEVNDRGWLPSRIKRLGKI